MKIVNRYIGVRDGYLGDFTYRTHAEFYPEYCGLDIDPATYPGTTRNGSSRSWGTSRRETRPRSCAV